MNTWNELPSNEIIEKAAEALRANGFVVDVVENIAEAKEKVLDIIPKGAEVMTNTSKTLDTIGVTEVINESGNYDAIHPKALKMDRATQGKEINALRTTADWNIGSAHAVTQDGHILWASGSGSQIPGYAYSSPHVLLVVGAQKIVQNIDEGIKRIYEHSLPLESKRMQETYGAPGSNVRRILIMNSDGQPDRFHVIIVKAVLGF